MLNRFQNAILYGIIDTGYAADEDFAKLTRELCAAGSCDVLQIRAKGRNTAQIVELAKECLPICTKNGVPLVINDDTHAAAELACDLHLGQDDMPLAKARKIVAKGTIIGKSTHSVKQARAALDEDADYIAFGPLFSTKTKPDYKAVGLEDIEKVRKLAERKNTPLFCIGGINAKTIAKVAIAHAPRVVIVSAILLAKNPRTKAIFLKEEFIKNSKIVS